MRRVMVALAAMAVFATTVPGAQEKRPGVILGDLTWLEAETALTPSTVVVLPLGAAAIEHGPHMKLDASDRLARYLAERVRAVADVVIAPTLTYHFYPAFLEYPGSTSLSQSTARDMTADIVRSLASHGPRRFYVLNTGVTTMSPLKAAAETLAGEGILLGYTDLAYRRAAARVERQQPTRGTPHADELETSMMLFVDASAVEMKKAKSEYGEGTGRITRQKGGPGVYSASGVLGDPGLATREKGQALVEAVVAGALEDIGMIRTARLPAAKAAPPAIPAPAPARQPMPRASDSLQSNGCLPSDERAIRAVGERFSYLWRQMDAENIALLFSENGDMRHPDGTIERGQNVIRDNRRELFNKREYRGSVHPVSLNDIRCVAGGVAIADGKWELRLEDSPGTALSGRGLGPGKRHAGWCTLVLTGAGGTWAIQAWRYTVNPPDGTQPPTTLKQPGFIGRGGG